MSNVEKITQQDKNDFKKLLEDMALSIKKEEKSSNKTTEVDENLLKLSSKIESISTQKEASDFLGEIQNELGALKEYSEFKNILSSLEKKVNELKDKYSKNIKSKLTDLQKDVFDKNNLTKEQLLKKADEGRKQASNNIKNGIIDKLSQRNDWIGKLAKKTNSEKFI